MKILVKKTNKGLLPMFDSDYENYSKIPIGEEFEIEYKKQRNLHFHKKMFALFKLTFENQEIYSNLNDLRRDLTITAGYYSESVDLLTGEIFKHAKSISFANMDEVEFSQLYESVKSVIIKWLGVTNEDLEAEILQYY